MVHRDPASLITWPVALCSFVGVLLLGRDVGSVILEKCSKVTFYLSVGIVLNLIIFAALITLAIVNEANRLLVRA